MSEADTLQQAEMERQLAAVRQHFTVEQIAGMDYLANLAVQKATVHWKVELDQALKAHSDCCPFQQRLVLQAGRAVIYVLIGLGSLGAVLWGIWKHKAGGQ
jgi:hypothetical protein